jgi:hypothetical protein
MTTASKETKMETKTDAAKFSAIPAKACTLSVGEFTLGDNGEGSKSAPVKLVARSGKPIKHWFWGRVVHDLAGMRLHKSRLPIDYVHDDKEILGYLNHFDSHSGDLVVSGALVPYKETDRASEIMHKYRQGVPYEASINFGGGGIKIQEVMQGQVAEVNGYQFDGPGVIIREWPLRGVAICPYGADQNTDSSVLANINSVFSASIVTPEATKEEAPDMGASVEVGTKAEAPKAEELKVAEVEAKAVEVKPEEVAKTVDPVQTEAVVLTEAKKEAKSLSRDEFTKIATDFGNDVAVKCMVEGVDYAGALKLSHDALKAKVAELESVKLSKNATPATVKAAPNKESGKLFKTGK